MNSENDTPKFENCSRILREFLKDYSRSPTRIRRKCFCIPKVVEWNPIIRLSNCKIVQRTRKSKMKHTTPTTVLFFNLTRYPISISVTSIATNVNGCGIGVMGNTLTMDMDKTENKIQTVRVYPYAFTDDDTRDYFSSDNSMNNARNEREKIHELLRDQEKFFLGEAMTKSKGKKKPRNGRSTSREEKHKLKIGKINRNLRLSSAMIDPCSHRYYLSIRIHDTDKGRLLMTDNIHRTNYDIIIREDDVKKPDFK
tara:strand:+ start:2052 stop:2813 length:762 start_codon:yes stop_codon:yes gene_type:complete